MKKIILLFITIIFLASCDISYYENNGIKYDDYDDYLEKRISEMKSPINILGISNKEEFWWASVTIIDGSWNILSIWNMSILSKTLSEKHIWDLIK